MTAGTEGYEKFIPFFIEGSQSLDFHDTCKDFLAYLPAAPANILDAGSGAGQNSAALAMRGFSVTAIEPMPEFLHAAKNTYKNISVNWLSGSLPHLTCFDSDTTGFDFVLICGVWHHLNDVEREQSVIRLTKIMKPNGRCAISLRNGPAGMGTRVYPTDALQTIELFKQHDFECIFATHNQPSIVSYKENVKWSRVVFQKQ